MADKKSKRTYSLSPAEAQLMAKAEAKVKRFGITNSKKILLFLCGIGLAATEKEILRIKDEFDKLDNVISTLKFNEEGSPLP